MSTVEWVRVAREDDNDATCNDAWRVGGLLGAAAAGTQVAVWGVESSDRVGLRDSAVTRKDGVRLGAWRPRLLSPSS